MAYTLEELNEIADTILWWYISETITPEADRAKNLEDRKKDKKFEKSFAWRQLQTIKKSKERRKKGLR